MTSLPMRSVAGCLAALAILVAACGSPAAGPARAPASAKDGCGARQTVVHASAPAQSSARYTEFCTPGQGGPMVAGPDGALWFTETGRRIGRITTAGVVTEYPIAGQPAAAIAAGPDGALWFAETGNRIGRLSVI